MKILIIEDDPVSAVLAEKAVAPFASEVLLSASGSLGLEHFKSAVSANLPFDLILLDLRLPDMDGHDVLVAIRESERARGLPVFDETKIVIVTAEEENYESMQLAQAAGVLDYIQKPIDSKILQRIFAREGFKRVASR